MKVINLTKFCRRNVERICEQLLSLSSAFHRKMHSIKSAVSLTFAGDYEITLECVYNDELEYEKDDVIRYLLESQFGCTAFQFQILRMFREGRNFKVNHINIKDRSNAWHGARYKLTIKFEIPKG